MREIGVFRTLILLTLLWVDFVRIFQDYIIVECDCSILYVYHRMWPCKYYQNIWSHFKNNTLKYCKILQYPNRHWYLLWPAPVPLIRFHSFLRLKQPPPSHPQQQLSKVEITFLTSTHQRGWGVRNSPPTLTVTSHRRTVMVRTTTTRITSSRAKIFPQLKISLRISRPSSRKPETSSRSLVKDFKISTPQGWFSPRTTRLTLRISWRKRQPRLKPPYTMAGWYRSSINFPLNLHAL